MEIVHVLDDTTLLNAESYQCRYKIAPGACLEPGFYVVLGSPDAHVYDEAASFVGPYRTRCEAAQAMREIGHGSIGSLLIAA